MTILERRLENETPLKIKPGKRKKTFRKEKIKQDLQGETG